MTAIDGMYMSPAPIPAQTPWLRKTYSTTCVSVADAFQRTTYLIELVGLRKRQHEEPKCEQECPTIDLESAKGHNDEVSLCVALTVVHSAHSQITTIEELPSKKAP